MHAVPLEKTSDITTRELARGDGWHVRAIDCRAGPQTRPFEERHRWASVSAVMRGSFSYAGQRGRMLLTPGSLLLGNADACYACGHEHAAGDRCIAFYFAPALLEEIAAAHPGARRAAFAQSRVPPLERMLPLLDAVAIVEERTTTDADVDVVDVEALAVTLAANALALSNDLAAPPVAARDEARVVASIRHIDADPALPHTLAGLAAQAGLDRYRYLRAFRRVAGATPYRYVLQRRLLLAARRLRHDDARVVDIACDCGFGDLSEFTRRFRARLGVTPGAYRRGERAGSGPLRR